jgi:hypothetical protein
MTLHIAYLDPGTGSIVIQAIIGSVAGVLFAFRNYIKNLGFKLRGSRATETEIAEK